MANKKDAKELYRRIYEISAGESLNSAGFFGPFGTNRGLGEELLKKVGIISGKISSSSLSASDVDDFFALCKLSFASGMMAQSDIDQIADILERNIRHGSDLSANSQSSA